MPRPLEAKARTTNLGGTRIKLPYPRLEGSTSLERTLANRRSIREYTGEPLTIPEIFQVLWSAYGVTETTWGFKTTPSAGATYPLEVYLVASRVEGLRKGSYRYIPYSHELQMVKEGDLSYELYRACVDQEWVLKAAANIVITAVYTRTTKRYGERGYRYVYMEVGHAGQNIYLQATALGLATVAIGAFYDDQLREIIGAPPWEHPLYVMTLAKPRRRYELTERQLINYYELNRLG
jgi:SagB-type dehydrogenase family enzyme